ncbi:MAG: MerR family transcriptional regulator [Syntrophomonadaceae bacterium]
MEERFYKISEVAEMLHTEQHTLRYLENTLKLKIKRNERGDRLYTESDIETLKLVMKLKEKGLNTTAIKMALENTEETETSLSPKPGSASVDIYEVVSIARRIVEQNEMLLEQNKNMEQRLEKLEQKIENRNLERERKIDEFLKLWKAEQESRGKSWLAKLRGKS